jgi:hypothetical protein
LGAGTTNLLSKYTDGINSVLGPAAGISDNGTSVLVAGSEPLLVKTLENSLYPNEFAGADAPCKIAAAITAAPANGAVLDARNSREVVRCECGLVQFVTLAGSCRRFHKAFDPFDSVEEPSPVPPSPRPRVAKRY